MELAILFMFRLMSVTQLTSQNSDAIEDQYMAMRLCNHVTMSLAAKDLHTCLGLLGEKTTALHYPYISEGPSLMWPEKMLKTGIIRMVINSGYFNPASGKYHITQMRHTLDGDPETTKAINAIEEIKYELRKPSVQMPSGMDRCDSLRKGLRTAGQPSQCVTGAQQLDKPATFRNEKMTKSIRNEFTGKERPTSLCTKEDYFQRRQGKIIYRTNGGLLPNYAGYIPGQMFLIGNTWGRDSFDAMGKHQNQKFQWTSLF